MSWLMAGPPTTVDSGGVVVVVVMGGSVDGGVRVVVGATTGGGRGGGRGHRGAHARRGRRPRRDAVGLGVGLLGGLGRQEVERTDPGHEDQSHAEGVLDHRRPCVPLLLTTHRALLGPTSVFLTRSTVSPIAERPSLVYHFGGIAGCDRRK